MNGRRLIPGLQSLDLSARGWPRVAAATVGGTLFCVAAALMVDSINFAGMSPDALRWAIFVDVALPTTLAAPLLFLLTYKMRELAIAYADLLVVATTDSLTNLLNRRAFTILVEAYLDRSDHVPAAGALLIVDADNFKLINDELGHARGDMALKIIAYAIKDTLRETDILGRIGGEEFAIFLPGMTVEQAAAAAERVRKAIGDAVFKSNGVVRQLTVSVGGVTFCAAAPYDMLFVVADQNLYAAKASGRDQVKMGLFVPKWPILPPFAVSH